jgi:hypothetical protein
MEGWLAGMESQSLLDEAGCNGEMRPPQKAAATRNLRAGQYYS